MTDLITNPTSEADMNAIRRMFEAAANTIVEASSLRRTVAELQTAVDALKADVEATRAHNRELDEMLAQTRAQRDEARTEASKLAAEVISLTNERDGLNHKVEEFQATIERERGDYAKLTDDKAQIESWYNETQAKLSEATGTNTKLQTELDFVHSELDTVHNQLEQTGKSYRETQDRLALSESARIEAEGILADFRAKLGIPVPSSIAA